MMMRPSWDHYFMGFAFQASTRGTCDRKRVGAALVVEQQVLATGYNGSISGTPHCDQVGHDMDGGRCVRTVHAEANALMQAAKHGLALKGGTCYTTASPCWECFRLLTQAGVIRIVYTEPYRTDKIGDEAKARITTTLDSLRLHRRASNSVEQLPPLVYTVGTLTQLELDELESAAKERLTHPDGVGDQPMEINPGGLLQLIRLARLRLESAAAQYG